MITTPYLALLLSILATAVVSPHGSVYQQKIIGTVQVGAENPDIVSRDRRFFYCSVESNIL